MNIEVKDSVFDPDLSPNSPREIHYRLGTRDNRTYYQLWLYLEGDDLPFVESVTYTLHESFADPNQTVRRTARNRNCKLEIWTWGLFTAKATILDTKGLSYVFKHELRYEEQLFPEGDPRYKREESGLVSA